MDIIGFSEKPCVSVSESESGERRGEKKMNTRQFFDEESCYVIVITFKDIIGVLLNYGDRLQ